MEPNGATCVTALNTGLQGSARHVKSKVLILEDEILVAMDIADTLSDAGFEVMGPYAKPADACSALVKVRPDAAMLDVNLGPHGTSKPVAELLDQHGVPFSFMTGYSHAAMTQAELFPAVKRIPKPSPPEELVEEVERLLAR
jgi:two-component SAPR family response regulator